jgi:hypothetical protein
MELEYRTWRRLSLGWAAGMGHDFHGNGDCNYCTSRLRHCPALVAKSDAGHAAKVTLKDRNGRNFAASIVRANSGAFPERIIV